MFPLPLCDRTVTVYRKEGDRVTRTVVQGCFYQYEDVLGEDTFQRKCLLIRPGAEGFRPGDRVLDGVGPEEVSWEGFLPVNVPGLSELSYATPWYWAGEYSHWEAGNE